MAVVGVEYRLVPQVKVADCVADAAAAAAKEAAAALDADSDADDEISHHRERTSWNEMYDEVLTEAKRNIRLL